MARKEKGISVMPDKFGESAIQQRAYELYQARGGLPGGELEDWLQAESEAQASQSASAPPSPSTAKQQPAEKRPSESRPVDNRSARAQSAAPSNNQDDFEIEEADVTDIAPARPRKAARG
jgi:hypothetical protein